MDRQNLQLSQKYILGINLSLSAYPQERRGTKKYKLNWQYGKICSKLLFKDVLKINTIGYDNNAALTRNGKTRSTKKNNDPE